MEAGAIRGRFEEAVGTLSARDRRLLGGMAVLVTMFMLGGGGWLASGRLSDIHMRIGEKEHTLMLLKSMKGDQESAAAQVERIEEALRQNAGRDLSAFVEQSAQNAGMAGNLQSVREKGATTDGNLEEKTYQAEISKVSLQQLNDFLHALETGGYPLRVQNLKVRTATSAGQKVLNATLEISAYRLIEEATGGKEAGDKEAGREE